MNDFGTFTKKGEDELHQEINRAFFKILEENDLYLHSEKCMFEQPEMDFLRIHVKNREISIDVTNKFWCVSIDWDHYYTHWESFKMGSAILGPLCLITVCL